MWVLMGYEGVNQISSMFLENAQRDAVLSFFCSVIQNGF
uniref:Uncharacterized protein n=1 Tax=Anguilla anguilla TaxID=7936 RepID=A0A0E9PJX4_ANGAN